VPASKTYYTHLALPFKGLQPGIYLLSWLLVFLIRNYFVYSIIF